MDRYEPNNTEQLTMAASILPQKRVLGETRTRQNIPSTPTSVKKRKTDIFSSSPAGQLPSSQNGLRGKLGSSQPKSAFESDVLEKLSQDISDLKQTNTEKDQKWERPALNDFVPQRDSLCFQSIEAEKGTLDDGRATVKLYGVTQEGYSAMLHVTDFKHYLYVAAPVLFQPSDCSTYRSFLEVAVAENRTAIHSVELVTRQSIYGYQGDSLNPYIKITVTDPRYVFSVRRAFKEGKANWKGMWKVGGDVVTYDNIDYVLRFMVDCHVRCALIAV